MSFRTSKPLPATAGLCCATLIRLTSGYASYCCRSYGTSLFSRGAAARRRGLLTRFERLHVQRIPERSFEARSSIASNVSPAARGALALRYMPGMVLRPAFSHSTDALRRRLAPLKSSHHLVAFQNPMLPCANNPSRPQSHLNRTSSVSKTLLGAERAAAPQCGDRTNLR